MTRHGKYKKEDDEFETNVELKNAIALCGRAFLIILLIFFMGVGILYMITWFNDGSEEVQLSVGVRFRSLMASVFDRAEKMRPDCPTVGGCLGGEGF